MKRLAAWLMHLSYKLEQHYLLQISLKNWFWFLVAVPPLLAVFRRMAWLNAALLALLGGLALLGTEWARRSRYLIFEPAQFLIVQFAMYKFDFNISAEQTLSFYRQAFEQRCGQ